MNFYEENMNSIKKSNKRLYDELVKIEKNREEIDNSISDNSEINKDSEENKEKDIDKIIEVTSVEAKDGNKVLVITKDEENNRMNSIYRPLEEAKKWATQFEFINMGIVVSVFGLGNGYFLRAMIKEASKGNVEVRYLIYEPSIKVFEHVITEYDMKDIFSNKFVNIYIEDINSREMVSDLDENIEYTNIEHQIRTNFPKYPELFISSYRKFAAMVTDNDTSVVGGTNTYKYYGKSMATNIIKNWKHIITSTNFMQLARIIPKDIPVIVVSSGPSLDNNIKELRKAKGKSIIIAADSALKYLLKENIMPDLVMTIDPQKSWTHFYYYEGEEWHYHEEINDIPLVCITEANNVILEFHKGKKIMADLDELSARVFEKMDKLSFHFVRGGSVSLNAYSIFLCSNFKNIILIGQDLSFKNGATHAGNSTLVVRDSDKYNKKEVDGVNGDKVVTRDDWYIYLKWMENAVAVNPDTTTIDATEGGAKIEGTKIMSLHDAIEEYCVKDYDIGKVLNEEPPTFNKEEQKSVYKKYEEYAHETEKMKILARDAKKLAEELILASKKSILDMPQAQKKVKKIKKCNKELEQTAINGMVDAYIADITSKNLDDIYEMSGNEMDNQVKTFEKAIELYDVTIQACKELEPLLEEEIGKMREITNSIGE